MSTNHKIVQLEYVNPAVSRKKKRGRLMALIATVLAAAAAVVILKTELSDKPVKVADYTTAAVTSGEILSTTEASGTVVLPIQVEIVSPEDSYADEIYVSEGDSITPETVLALLESPNLDDEKDSLTVSLKQALIELENINSEYNYEIKNLTRSITRLSADIADAQADADTAKALAELKSSRESDYEEALDNLESLQEELEDLNSELEQTLAKKDIDIRKQDASIEQIRVNLEIVNSDIEALSVKSPISGEVLSINESLGIPGSSIETTDSLFVIADRSEAYIDFDVYEQYAGLLETGGKMTVTSGTNTFEAEITKIGRIATMDSDGLAAMVTVRARPLTDLELTPGASAVASISLGMEENVIYLPRGAYLTTGSQKWVYLVNGDSAVKTAVSFGDIEGAKVKIKAGLNEGDVIITSGYQNFIDQKEIQLARGGEDD